VLLRLVGCLFHRLLLAGTEASPLQESAEDPGVPPRWAVGVRVGGKAAWVLEGGSSNNTLFN